MLRNIEYKDQHILIVDDTKTNLLILESILASYGITEIYKASSAKEAYTILEKQEVDAILLDVMMPDIDGIQACRSIRLHTHYNLIPIIMVTGSTDDETLQKSFDAGANDFIEKPINKVALMGRLNSQLRQREMELDFIENSRFSAKGEMISMLAHQWRQPLSHISIIASSIQAGIHLNGIDEKGILSSLEEIENSVKNLSNLLNSFTTCLIENKIKTPTKLPSLLFDILLLLKPLIDENHIIIEEAMSTDEFIIDRQSLQQALMNILTNSIESFKDFQTQAPKISLSTKQSGNHLTLTIEDNGKGIAKELLSKIYEPYISTKEEKNGKGLGLYVAKLLIENNLKGKLSIQSNGAKTLATIEFDVEDQAK